MDVRTASRHTPAMTSAPRRKHSAVLREILPLAGARIADIGCGDGGLVRLARGGFRFAQP